MTSKIVQTNEELIEFLETCYIYDKVSLDVETTGFLNAGGQICGWCIGNLDEQVYVPVRHTAYSLVASEGLENLKPEVISELVKMFVEKYQGKIILHNGRFDFEMIAKDWFPKDTAIRSYNFWKNKQYEDTYIIAHLLDENRRNGLKPLTESLLAMDVETQDNVKLQLAAYKKEMKKRYKEEFFMGREGRKKVYKECTEDKLKEWTKNFKDNYSNADIKTMGVYGAEDTERTLKLYDFLIKDVLDNEEFQKIYGIERDLINTAAYMDLNGVRVDTDYFKNLKTMYTTQILELTEEIKNVYGDFELSSPKQYAAKLISLNCDLPLTEKGAPSTNEVALKEAVKTAPPAAKDLIFKANSLRKIKKLLNTYVNEFAFNTVEGRIHASLNTVGATTGRMSMSNPPLQQIPKRASDAIRKGFKARENYKLFCLDYDSMEAVATANITKDKKMCEIMNSGKDIYQYLAGFAEEIDYDAVPKELRDTYKTVWLMTLYGSGVENLLRFTDKAHQIKDLFAEAFPQFSAYTAKLEGLVRTKGWIHISDGRRRRLEAKESYKALNAKIQGYCATIMKKALIKIAAYLIDNNFKSKLILTIHDEALIETHESEFHIIPVIKSLMEDHTGIVPITVGVDYCEDNWSDKESVEF